MDSLGRTGGAVIQHSSVFYVGFGFAIWAIATVIFRLFGETFFISENSIVMLLIFVVTGISLYLLTTFILNIRRAQSSESLSAVIFLVLPGMLLDSVVVMSFSRFFPNLNEETAAPFTAWLLFAYAAVLITGKLYKPKSI